MASSCGGGSPEPLDPRFTGGKLPYVTVESPGRTERPIHNVAFKCTDSQLVVIETLAASIDPPTTSSAMRWLLDDPEIRDVIRRQVQASG